MSNFVVTARKWRPQRFEDVVGQEHITSTLKNAIKEKELRMHICLPVHAVLVKLQPQEFLQRH